jgi:hypothetical protein
MANWTKAPPSEPGWYFFIAEGSSRTVIIEVSYRQDRLWVNYTSDKPGDPQLADEVERVEGWWWPVPIQMPKRPDEPTTFIV